MQTELSEILTVGFTREELVRGGQISPKTIEAILDLTDRAWARAEAAEAKIARVYELHQKTDIEVWGHGMEGPVSHIEWRCAHCDEFEDRVPYPCPTIIELEGGEQDQPEADELQSERIDYNALEELSKESVF